MAQFKDAESEQYLKHTEYPRRDKVFNWVVKRHTAAGRKRSIWSLYLRGEMRDGLEWTVWENYFWNAVIYVVWDYFAMLMFLYVIYALANYTYDHYGLFRAVAFLCVTALIRLNSLIRLQGKTNRLLEKRNS